MPDTKISRERDGYKGLIFSWCFKESDHNLFLKYYEAVFLQKMESQQSGKSVVRTIIPLWHKGDINGADPVDNCVTAVSVALFDNFHYEEISDGIERLVEISKLNFPISSIDVVNPQRNLDIFYPKKSGPRGERRLFQWIEYVKSNAAHRAAYYKTQYEFSGPAMRMMWDKNTAGRFIGFEFERRLHGNVQESSWDIIHVSGFTAWQVIKYLLFSRKYWELQAKRVFGDSRTSKDIFSEWERIREKKMIRVFQMHDQTVQMRRDPKWKARGWNNRCRSTQL